MNRCWLFLVLLISSPATFAALPEVLECTVGFSIKPHSPIAVTVAKDTTRHVRVIHSAQVPGNRWLFLIRFLGSSASQFTGDIQFESTDAGRATFQLHANSGRHFGDVQLFDLELISQGSSTDEPRSAKAELVSAPSPEELNSYASLSGRFGFQNSDVTNYEINCGPVGWNFGGL